MDSKMDNRRRKDDDNMKLLIELNIKMENIQRILDEKFTMCNFDIKSLETKQDKIPCKTHELRITFLEKMSWLVFSTLAFLIGRLLYKAIV